MTFVLHKGFGKKKLTNANAILDKEKLLNKMVADKPSGVSNITLILFNETRSGTA